MATFATPLASLRTRLGEPTARKWTDATLINYLSMAERWYAGYFGPKPGVKLYRQLDSITLTANSNTVAIYPPGSAPTTLTKEFTRLVTVALVWSDSSEIPLGLLDDADESAARNVNLVASGPMIPRYKLEGNYLFVAPSSAEARTLKVRYQYVPALRTSSSDNLDDDTPTDARDLLVLRALHFALADGKEENSAFEKEHIARIDEELGRLVNRDKGIRGERVRRRASRLLYR